MDKVVERIGSGVRITRPVEVVKYTLDEYLEARYKMTREGLSPRAQMMVKRVEDYIEALGGRVPQSVAKITEHQTGFLQTTLGILGSESNDALLCWDILLFLAYKNAENLFNGKKACQHYHTLATDKQQQFLGLMTLIVETANIRNRASFLRNSDLKNYTAMLTNEKQRANLAAYYASNI